MTRIEKIEQKYKRRRNRKWIIWIIASFIITLNLSAQASPKTAADLDRYVSVTVTPGDTLWEIAEDVNALYYQNTMDPRKIVEHMTEVNQIQSVVIQEGQTLKVSMSLGEH